MDVETPNKLIVSLIHFMKILFKSILNPNPRTNDFYIRFELFFYFLVNPQP